MEQEHDFMTYFYKKFEGRVAIGVGYDQNLSEIYPFVFEDTDGKSIGVVALGVYTIENMNYVHIYHLGAFENNRGNGSQILQELCFQANEYQIINLPLGIVINNSDDPQLVADRIVQVPATCI